jgi:hypothetical protein
MVGKAVAETRKPHVRLGNGELECGVWNAEYFSGIRVPLDIGGDVSSLQPRPQLAGSRGATEMNSNDQIISSMIIRGRRFAPDAQAFIKNGLVSIMCGSKCSKTSFTEFFRVKFV